MDISSANISLVACLSLLCNEICETNYEFGSVLNAFASIFCPRPHASKIGAPLQEHMSA